MNKGRVVVAMSGGVDSSVAALLLQRQGYDVVGVTMRLWTTNKPELSSLNKQCCTAEDTEDAQRVCQIIGVPHYIINFEREFKKHVIDYFCKEYDSGRTPHPCLACNDKIKFDFLLRRALFLDCDYVATGHYARIHQDGKQFKLLKGKDPRKDQSYVLFNLTQTELKHLLLPVGEYPKSRIREIAAETRLPIADKPDSQEICFIPDNDYKKFVGQRSKPRPGKMVDRAGKVIGSHPGIQFFTIGQRRGLGLNGNSGSPMYVTSIESATNRVTLGLEQDLYMKDLWASSINMTSGVPPKNPISVTAKIRYKASEAPATVTIHKDQARIRFDNPQRAITPGQAVVFYHDDELIGGGIIETSAPKDSI